MAGGSKDDVLVLFFEPSNYTQIPNVMLDELMPEIGSLAELKVTLAILRETLGWSEQRGPRLLSLSRLQELTGLSRQSAQDGVTKARERGFIGRRAADDGNGFVYGMRVAKNLGSGQESRPAGSQESRPPSNTEERKGLKKVEKQAKEASQKLPDIDPFDALILELFEAWKTGTDHPKTKLDKPKRSKITKQIEQAVDANNGNFPLARLELLDAVAGMVESEWHQENGHTNFAQIFRDRERITFFLDRRRAGQKKASASGGQAPPGNEEYETTRPNPELEDK